jgi:hypothetical protein
MRTFFSIILLVILIPATYLALAFATLHWNIATPHFFKSELSKRNAYALMQDQMVASIEKSPAAMALSAEETRSIVMQVFPEIWLRENTELLIDHSFTWMNGGEDEKLSLPLSLSDPKAELLTLSGEPKIKKYIDQAAMGSDADIKKVFTALPDTFDLADPRFPAFGLGEDADKEVILAEGTFRTQIDEVKSTAKEAKKNYAQILEYYYIALFALGVVFALYLGLIAKGIKKFFTSLGIGTTISGICIAGITLVLKTMMDTRFPVSSLVPPDAPSGVQKIIPLLVADIEKAFFFPMFAAGIAFIVLGIFFLLKAKDEEAEVPGQWPIIRPDPT